MRTGVEWTWKSVPLDASVDKVNRNRSCEEVLDFGTSLRGLKCEFIFLWLLGTGPASCRSLVKQLAEVVWKVRCMLCSASEKRKIWILITELRLIGICLDQRDEFACYTDAIVLGRYTAVSSGHLHLGSID